MKLYWFCKPGRVTWHRCPFCNALSDFMSTKAESCRTYCSADRKALTINDVKRMRAIFEGDVLREAK